MQPAGLLPRTGTGDNIDIRWNQPILVHGTRLICGLAPGEAQ